MILCTSGAACAMLGCSKDELEALVNRKILRPIKLGSRVRFVTEDVEIVGEWFEGAYYVEGEEECEQVS